ncbi:Conserved hypothetical protein [Criblamydia sequanensis CRIB-18]|uniref:Uncharacterized protein n=1 Tax=Candidatus Criblamydia sequanensis CRIB-18 TaxID=1437425 RepID=A0A090D128_9BACT|nr:hypothetical protein [Criblamydia sequanensis]CDR35268.1 Conserved hypothetical protein [Criblamydia sequanensis CRIB-18]
MKSQASIILAGVTINQTLADGSLLTRQASQMAKPGEQDVVRLLIECPEEKGSSEIEFSDCYALHLSMNFGIVASESILMQNV